MPAADHKDHSLPHSRAEALASSAFFTQKGRSIDIFFAEMPAGENAHRLVYDAGRQQVFCSCPFYPKPCWHALAFTRYCTANEDFGEAGLPHWADRLRQGRPTASAPTTDRATEREAATQKRRFERLERADAGLEDLERWLLDTLRRGLATVASDDARFAEHIAARAADASLGGLSRQLRLLDALPSSQPDWAESTLGVLSDIWTAIRAFNHRDRLPAALLHDLQTCLGIAAKKEEALSGNDLVDDTWAIVGRREEPVENQLLSRRTWLLGARSGRYALLLEYAFGLAGTLPPGFEPGELVKGTLAFYPSAFPLRATPVEHIQGLNKKVEKLPGYADCNAMSQAWATALGKQPWLTLFPAAFPALTPVRHGDRCWLRDASGLSLPLAGMSGDGWKLLALSGGRAVALFGEWDGAHFRALSVVAEGRMQAL